MTCNIISALFLKIKNLFSFNFDNKYDAMIVEMNKTHHALILELVDSFRDELDNIRADIKDLHQTLDQPKIDIVKRLFLSKEYETISDPEMRSNLFISLVHYFSLKNINLANISHIGIPINILATLAFNEKILIVWITDANKICILNRTGAKPDDDKIYELAIYEKNQCICLGGINLLASNHTIAFEFQYNTMDFSFRDKKIFMDTNFEYRSSSHNESYAVFSVRFN